MLDPQQQDKDYADAFTLDDAELDSTDDLLYIWAALALSHI